MHIYIYVYICVCVCVCMYSVLAASLKQVSESYANASKSH